MRKFIGTIMCTIMLFLLCSCGEDKSSTVNSSIVSKPVVTEAVATEENAASNQKEYYYITVDKTVGLCDYHNLSYNKYDTSVTEAEIEDRLQSTLEYFQTFMEITELSDELINEYYEEYSTVDDLRQAYGVMLQEKKEAERIEYIREEILKQLLAESDVFVDYTEEAKATLKSLMAHYDALAVSSNKTTEEYVEEVLKHDYEEFKKQVAEDATTLTLRRVILLAVAESEGLEITEKEYNDRIQNYMEYYGYTNQDVFEYEYTIDYIKKNMLNDVALEYLMTVAVEI